MTESVSCLGTGPWRGGAPAAVACRAAVLLPPTERTALKFPATVLALACALAAALAACETPSEACGEVPPGGGPRRIVTQEHELCEITRLRVETVLAETPGLEELVVERWIDASWGWTDAKTPDGVVVRIREDCGDVVADAVAKAVADVRAHSTRDAGPGCPDAEKCLARGAGTGARIAIQTAHYFLKKTAPPPQPATATDP